MKQNKNLKGVAIFLSVIVAAAILGSAAFFITSKLYKGRPYPATVSSPAADAVSQTDAATTGGSGAENETDAVKPSVSAETIVDIFLENRDVWETALEEYEWNYASYGFLDLDFDGIPELIIHHSEGSGEDSDNRYYKANVDSRTVTRINGEEEDFDPGYDLFYTNEEIMPKLLKNDITDELYYYCTDVSRMGIVGTSRRYGTMRITGESLLCNLLFFENTEAAGFNDHEEELNEYKVYNNGEGEDVDVETYEQSMDDFFSQHENMDLHYKTIDCFDYHTAEEAEKREMLLGSCKAFRYTGFSME